jgi:hypothetical protein
MKTAAILPLTLSLVEARAEWDHPDRANPSGVAFGHAPGELVVHAT